MKVRYKGWELLKAIANGEIEENSKFIDTYGEEYIYRQVDFDDMPILYMYDSVNKSYETPDYSLFADSQTEFELVEDEIDIENIEEIDIDQVIGTDDKAGIAFLHINKLIKAVKQLKREIDK